MKNHLRPKKIYLLGINLIISKTNSPLSGSAPERSLPLLLVQSNLLGVFLAENARQAWIGAGVGWERTGTSDFLPAWGSASHSRALRAFLRHLSTSPTLSVKKVFGSGVAQAFKALLRGSASCLNGTD